MHWNLETTAAVLFWSIRYTACVLALNIDNMLDYLITNAALLTNVLDKLRQSSIKT